MGVVSHLSGEFMDDKGNIMYVSNYYNNGKAMNIELTDDKSKQRLFSGAVISGRGVYDDDADCYGRDADPRILRNIYFILKRFKELSYLNICNLKIYEIKDEDRDNIKLYRDYERVYRPKDLKPSLKIRVTDTINDKHIELPYIELKEYRRKMPFGKYKGMEIIEMINKYPQYALWIAKNTAMHFKDEELKLIQKSIG